VRACGTWWLLVVSLVVGCGGAPATIRDGLVLTDPVGDDHGPGGYVYPQGDVLRKGALDLREVRLARDGDAVVVEVAFHRPVAFARGVRLATEQRADLFLATVDLYIDLRREEVGGHRGALPGRGVQLPDGLGWDLAIVLSPIPSRLSGAIAGHASAGSVLVPARVRVRGRTLRARVPASMFQGAALDRVGVAAAVTGTVFGSTFRTEVDGMVPHAFVREVTPSAGRCDRWEEQMDGAPCTFGGCVECHGHPRVLDALHPEPGAQEAALAQWDGDLKRLAILPMVWGDGSSRGVSTSREFVEAVVVDRRDGLLTIRASERDLPVQGALVDGVDSAGAAVGTLVLRKRILEPEGALGVFEVVTGEAALIVAARWPVFRSTGED
jgi:hypothetical protein